MKKWKKERREKKEVSVFISDATRTITIGMMIVANIEAGDVKFGFCAKSGKRVFRLHRYGADLKILIRENGDIEAMFRSAADGEVRFPLMNYKEICTDPDEAVDDLGDIINMFVGDFFGPDWDLVMENMKGYTEGCDWSDYYPFDIV